MSEHAALTKPTIGDYFFTISMGLIVGLFTAYDLAGNWHDAIRYVVLGACLLAANDARRDLIRSRREAKASA